MVWLFLLKSVPSFGNGQVKCFCSSKLGLLKIFLISWNRICLDCQSLFVKRYLTKPPRLQSENLREMRYHYNISALLIRESLTSENHACITTKSLQWKLLFLRCYAWRTKSFIIIERIIYMLLLQSYRKAWV